MNFSETDSYTVMSRSHHSESLLHNSRLSIECEILSFFNETAAKEDTERIYTLHCHCVNLHFNEENQA